MTALEVGKVEPTLRRKLGFYLVSDTKPSEGS